MGFRKSSVMKTMLTEISWISLLGLLNGAIVAMAFHVALHRTFWEEQGADLILPWFEVTSVVLADGFLFLIATIIPVRKAYSNYAFRGIIISRLRFFDIIFKKR